MPITSYGATPSKAERWTAALRLTRPGNVVLSAVGVYVGAAAVAPGGPVGSADVGWAILSAAAGTVGGNVLNDIGDMDLDRQAHPDRALPLGAVTVRAAAALVLVSWLVALGAAAFVSMTLVVAVAALLGLLVAYEAALKRTGLSGNLVVAAVAGALFPFGAIAASGSIAGARGVPLVMGGIAALAHLGRELQKDAEDAAADAQMRRTFAVRHGPRLAAIVGALALMGAVLLSPLPHLLYGWSDAYLVAVTGAGGVFLVAAWRGIHRPGSGRAWAKFGMLVALAAFAVGALWESSPLG